MIDRQPKLNSCCFSISLQWWKLPEKYLTAITVDARKDTHPRNDEARELVPLQSSCRQVIDDRRLCMCGVRSAFQTAFMKLWINAVRYSWSHRHFPTLVLTTSLLKLYPYSFIRFLHADFHQINKMPRIWLLHRTPWSAFLSPCVNSGHLLPPLRRPPLLWSSAMVAELVVLWTSLICTSSRTGHYFHVRAWIHRWNDDPTY